MRWLRRIIWWLFRRERSIVFTVNRYTITVTHRGDRSIWFDGWIELIEFIKKHPIDDDAIAWKVRSDRP